MSEGRRFHLRRRLGAGGHGEVFLAEQESQGGFRRRVALKVLRPELGHHPEAARRIRDEARILGRLSHRNIVGVTDLVRLDDRWAVVMDFVEGADLERVGAALHRAGERMPPRAAAGIGLAVLRALAAAWRMDNGDGAPMRLVHRDLKPSNVLLAADGSVKVLDFGVARVDLVGRESRTGAVQPGTVRYMAPERLDRGEDGPAGDVYAWGATLYELLALEPLGRAPSQPQAHAAWLRARLDDLEAALTGPSVEVGPPGLEVGAPAPGALPALRGILASALAAEPGDRPTAAALADRMHACLDALPGDGVDAFARRFLPRLPGLVGADPQPVTGTLWERSLPSPALTPATWLDAAVDDDVTGIGLARAAAGTDPVRAQPRWGWGLGAAVVAALLCTGLLTLRPPGGPSAAVEGPAVVLDASEPSSPTPAPTGARAPRTSARPAASGPRPPSVVSGGAASAAVEEGARPRTGGPPPPGPAASAPTARVGAALFVFPEASAMDVSCGSVSGEGTASVRLRDLPAGPCRVGAVFLGERLATTVAVTERAEVRCGVDEGRLSCR